MCMRLKRSQVAKYRMIDAALSGRKLQNRLKIVRVFFEADQIVINRRLVSTYFRNIHILSSIASAYPLFSLDKNLRQNRCRT